MEDQMQEINAIIKKNLPAQVGKELQGVLAQGEADKAALKKLEGEFATLEQNYDELKDKKAAWEKVQQEKKTLADERAKFEEEKRDAKVEELTYKLAEAEKRADTVKEFTASLVRNTLVRKTIFDTETPGSYQDSNGNWHYPTPTTKAFDETKTEE